MIIVEKIDDRTYTVTVQASSTTSHQVNVDPGYAEKLCAGKATTERLLEASFEFLLQREPNTSILRSFALPVIGQYFPEYESSIGDLL
jgi:hypothetical protein